MRLLAVVTAAAALAVVASSAAPAGAGSATSCGDRAYTYAGYAASGRAHGASAVLTALAAPAVANGHVAAWVGVGGPGQGPNGADEWLQVGISGSLIASPCWRCTAGRTGGACSLTTAP